jgi:hypothetical protein
MKTEEEKKEAARLRAKKYYHANKEKVAAYYKKYNADSENKIKRAAYAKKTSKAYKDSQKDGLFTVYCLPKENYVGMTTTLIQRLHAHKSHHNRDTEGAYVLSKHKTKREALDTEASYHAKGFKGCAKYNGFKKGHQLWRKKYE